MSDSDSADSSMQEPVERFFSRVVPAGRPIVVSLDSAVLRLTSVSLPAVASDEDADELDRRATLMALVAKPAFGNVQPVALATVNEDVPSTTMEATFYEDDGMVRLAVSGSTAVHVAGTLMTTREVAEGDRAAAGAGEEEDEQEEVEDGSDDGEGDEEGEGEDEEEEEQKPAKRRRKEGGRGGAGEGSDDEEEGGKKKKKKPAATREAARKVAKRKEAEKLAEEAAAEEKRAKKQAKKAAQKAKKEAAAAAAAPPAPAADGAKEKRKAAKMQRLPSGLQYQDQQVGHGTLPKKGHKVTVRYVGRLKGSGKVFDQSKNRGFQFRLGVGQVIKGWDIGVASMRKGGKRKLIIPPHMAYGKRGSPPVIPPNATLEFDVELLNSQ